MVREKESWLAGNDEAIRKEIEVVVGGRIRAHADAKFQLGYGIIGNAERGGCRATLISAEGDHGAGAKGNTGGRALTTESLMRSKGFTLGTEAVIHSVGHRTMKHSLILERKNIAELREFGGRALLDGARRPLNALRVRLRSGDVKFYTNGTQRSIQGTVHPLRVPMENVDTVAMSVELGMDGILDGLKDGTHSSGRSACNGEETGMFIYHVDFLREALDREG